MKILACFHARCIVLYALLPLIAVCTIAAPQTNDSLQNTVLLSPDIDDTLVQLRRTEMELEAQLERFQIDVATAEKKWQAARISATESRLANDTNEISSLRSKVLWEQLTAYRTDFENAKQLHDCYARHRGIRTMYLDVRSRSEPTPELWKEVADSSRQFYNQLREECRLRNDRMRDVLFELTALQNIITNDSSGLSAEEKRLLTLRKKYLLSQQASDSVMQIRGQGMYPAVSRYQEEAENRLKTITVAQKMTVVVRKLSAAWHFEIRNVDGKPLTVGKIITALLVILVGLIIAQVFSKWISRAVSARLHVDAGITDAGQKLFFYAFAFIFTIFALYTVQVPLTAFTVAGGALALGIGFGSQNILNNFISGIILLLERPIKTGDFVEIDHAMGTVESIGLRSTRIRTPANVHLILPNSSFLEKNVINWTLADRTVRLELQVGVQYGSPVKEVKRLLLAAANEMDRVLNRPEPFVLFSDFGDNALIFHLMVWIKLDNIIERRTILSALRFKINEFFNQAGIVIAFPQRDVHLDTVKPLHIKIENDANDNDKNRMQ